MEEQKSSIMVQNDTRSRNGKRRFGRGEGCESLWESVISAPCETMRGKGKCETGTMLLAEASRLAQNHERPCLPFSQSAQPQTARTFQERSTLAHIREERRPRTAHSSGNMVLPSSLISSRLSCLSLQANRSTFLVQWCPTESNEIHPLRCHF
jgi:hypothetical protein